MALKVLNYSHGYSGVHPDTVNQLLKFINNEVLPAVPEKGSVGASGDLAQLAHIASSLIGEGKIIRGEKVVTSKNVLNKLNIKPLKLRQKDGISLVNGTQYSTALAIKSLCDHRCIQLMIDLLNTGLQAPAPQQRILFCLLAVSDPVADVKRLILIFRER